MDIHALFSLKGKTAVVTGASGALGGAAVRAMAYAGANVAACYNSGRERLDTLISEIGDVGVEIKPYKVNSFSQDEIRQHAEDVMRDFGGIDVVINTAGGNVKGAYYTDEQSLFDLDAQPQFDTVTLNLFGGCFWPCLASRREDARQPRRRIDPQFQLHQRVHGYPWTYRLCRCQGGGEQFHPVPRRAPRP